MSNLQWTGERMMDEPFFAKGIVEHLHRYAISLEFVQDKVVLDIACGEGYGSNLLSKKAKKVFGIDISEEAIIHAKEKYKEENLHFLSGSVLDIPLDNATVDVVVCFETLEHVVEQESMLIEFNRVLKENGILIISTPEKENYHEVDPNNPYHLKELTFVEFKNLLSNFFINIKIAHQQFMFCSQILFENKPMNEWVQYTGSFENIEKGMIKGGHYFNIAICTNSNNPILVNCSMFNGNSFFRRFENSIWQIYFKVKSEMMSSVSYKIGSSISAPYRLFKRLLRIQKKTT